MKKLGPYLLFAAVLDLGAGIFYRDTLRMPKAAYQMPRILIGLILLLSLLMIAERVWQLRKEGSPEEDAIFSGKINWLRMAGFVFLLLAYIVTIEPLGYFIATPAFLIATFGFLKSTKPHWIAAIAVGFTGFVYLLFVLFLHMPVPMGLLA